MNRNGKTILQLNSVFGFTSEDLLANREGFLSERQKKRLGISSQSFLRANLDELSSILIYLLCAGWFIFYTWRGYRSAERQIVLYCILSLPLLGAILFVTLMANRIVLKQKNQNRNRGGELLVSEFLIRAIRLDRASRILAVESEFQTRLTEQQLRIMDRLKSIEPERILKVYYWSMPNEEFARILSVDSHYAD